MVNYTCVSKCFTVGLVFFSRVANSHSLPSSPYYVIGPKYLNLIGQKSTSDDVSAPRQRATALHFWLSSGLENFQIKFFITPSPHLSPAYICVETFLLTKYSYLYCRLIFILFLQFYAVLTITATVFYSQQVFNLCLQIHINQTKLI